MLDSSPINVSEEAMPAIFELAVPNKQSEFQRSVRNPIHRRADRGNWRVNDRIEDENVSLEVEVAANRLAIGIQHAVRLDEEKRIAEEVERRVAKRTKELVETNRELQLQAGLLQHLPVSAWTLDPDGTPDFVNQVWLQFAGQTLDFVRSHPEAWMTAVHPEDREMAARFFWEGVHSGQGFAIETRSLRAQDRTYRWHLQQAVPLRDVEGKVIKFVGTTTDIDDQKRTEEAFRQAQGDLARINRVTTMGELAASLAHEISQPISGAITNTNVCLRKLERDKPDLDEVRAAVTKIARDAQRAAEILNRIRSQFEKSSVNQETVEISELVRETVALLRSEAVRHNISVRTELAIDLPQIVGDRVQLQQVAMNLIVNSIEAMKGVDGLRELVITSRRTENEQVLVSVSDTGIGVPPHLAEEIFDPFFTTKPHGTGMGLRISRTIIESLGGRLWAVCSSGRGAIFHLSLPAIADGSELLGCQIAPEYRSASPSRSPVPPCLPQVAL
jgi:PAS domain S-box-containing protein